MSTILRGVIEGNTIRLRDQVGLPDGQEVTVSVEPIEANLAPGEGLRRAFGAWSDDASGLDEFLDWNRHQREIGRPEIDQ